MRLGRRTPAAALAATALAATALAGCGGQQREGGPVQATSGDAIFREAGCAGCHTLSAAGARGTNAPNLDERRPSAEEVQRKVTEGGGGMPSFRGRLTEQQIQAVAEYVAQSAGRGGR